MMFKMVTLKRDTRLLTVRLEKGFSQSKVYLLHFLQFLQLTDKKTSKLFPIHVPNKVPNLLLFNT